MGSTQRVLRSTSTIGAWKADFPIRSEIRCANEVFVGPLAVALDKYERVGIVLLDRSNLRLFAMFLGEVEEHIREGFNHSRVRHTKTVGMNHMGSASHAQRKADEQVRLNLRHVAKDMQLMFEQGGIHRLILAAARNYDRVASDSAKTARIPGVDSLTERELFRWFPACLLFGKPIQQQIARRAFLQLDHAGLDSPQAILNAGWDRLVDLLDRAHTTSGMTFRRLPNFRMSAMH